jgi:hypothetical protein
MLDYDSIKSLSKRIGRSVKDLLALAAPNDPFYAGVGARGEAARWFAEIWQQHGLTDAHLRRIHYQLVSQPKGARILLPNGREYQNTEADWNYLCSASLAARYLDLVPFDGLIDRRNDEPMLHAADAAPRDREPEEVETEVSGGISVDIPDRPQLPQYTEPTIPALQDFIVEVWIEKSTQNDWLVPLCTRRGVNLVVGIGEQSETRSRELALRAKEYGVPVRVIYLSDFDPGGRSMPKAVARKAEFTIAKFEMDVDLQLIPLVLTPDQCRRYKLPRTPIKDTERRKDKFERTFGRGATELDALEALRPGEMARLLEAEIDNWLDPDLERRVQRVRQDQNLVLCRIEREVEENHAEEIDDLTNRFEAITEQLREWESEAEELWGQIEEELEAERPDLSDVEVPHSEAPGETDSFVLYDSKRDYLTQMDFYLSWREGDE